MLDFTLDQEQEMLTNTINRFAEEQMRKVFRDADEERMLPAGIVQAGWEIGLLPTSLPESYGGFGAYSLVTNALGVEALAYGDLALTLAILTPNLVAMPLLLAGNEAQKEAYLPWFCQDRLPQVTAAMVEPAIQFNPRRLRTEAVLEGDSYTLNGLKSMVPMAVGAELLLVYANDSGRTQAFLLPRDSEGVTILAREKWMGIRALPTYGLKLENVRVPAGNRLGGAAGIDYNLIFNHHQVGAGAAAVGLAKAAYDYAREYAKNRIQFGEPIAHRQSIAFMLAEMAMDIDAARLMVWEAAWLADRGQEITREAALLKSYCTDMVLRVADRALQTLGGHGYIREYPVELWLRNARGFTTFDNLIVI